MKTKRFVSTITYTVFIFAAILLYCCICGFRMDNTGIYSLFLGDFSIGICSRFLVGSIISIFKDTVSREWVVSMLRVVTAVVFLITAHYTGSVISNAEKTQKQPLILFTSLFIICPFSITIYAGDIFGFIDVFCMVVLLMTAYFAENRILVFSMPLLIIAGIFIHDSFITGYMAPCFGILAYYVIKKYGRKLWASLIFILSALCGAATSVYSVFFSRKTIKMTESELLGYLAKKGNTTVADVSGYLEDALFFSDVRHVVPDGTEKNIFIYIYYAIQYAIEGLGNLDLLFILSITPLVILFFTVWIHAVKNSHGFFEKLPYILFMLTPVPQLISLVMSIDFTRFLSTIIITQTIYLFMCVREKDNPVCSWLSNPANRIQPFFIPSVFILLINLTV